MQGLFVPYARVGSGDPVRVLCLFHNEYSGYCCIHLLCKATYNLSLPILSANYYGLPTTVQLWAAHESQCSLFGVSRSTAQVLYCTCLERYILRDRSTISILNIRRRSQRYWILALVNLDHKKQLKLIKWNRMKILYPSKQWKPHNCLLLM